MIPNSKKIYLCSPDLYIRTTLNGVLTETVDFHPQVKGYSELSFTVDRYVSINGEYVESNGYDELLTYMYIYLEDIGFFLMDSPQITYDGNKEQKQIVAYSVEKEFEARDWVGIKINCGTSDSLEYAYTDENNKDKYGFAIQYITMLNNIDKHLSFLHLILEKMSDKWHIQYVSPSLINAKIPAIDIDSENLYAVMTSEVAPRLSCLFVFDYLHFGISVFHKDELDDELDTGIFIGFRNLENSVTISTDSDSIFTRFTVQGDSGIEFRDVNYGENYIINMDYFLDEPYMDAQMVRKFRKWKELKEKYRESYINYAKQRNQLSEKVQERTSRVPSDASYWTNWNSMNEEGLRENLQYYRNLLEKLQISVDDRTPAQMYDSIGDYVPKRKNGEIDHEWYKQQLYNQVNIYGGYYTYCEILEYIIPYIELAISNLGQIDKTDPDYSITQNWELYGLDEIKGVRDDYQGQIKTLDRYSKAWNEMTEEELKEKGLEYITDELYEQETGRIEYLKLNAALGDENTPGTILYRIKQLEDEIEQLNERIAEIDKITNQFALIVKYDIDEDGLQELTELSELFPLIISEREQSIFNEDELRTFDALLKDTDYVNSNILKNSIMSIDEQLQVQRDLLADSEDKLSEVSQPQYKFSVNLDNFFRLDQYSDWTSEFQASSKANVPQLGMLKFIRVGLRDDYVVKLRVVGYRWNPCEITPELTLEFSNMISSRSGRSDLTELLEQTNYRGSKNSIRIGTGTASSEQEYITALLDLLADNSTFVKQVKQIASGVVVIGGGGGGGTGGVDGAAVRAIIGNYVSEGGIDSQLDARLASGNIKINVGNLTGEAGEFETLFAEKIGADYIATKMLEADTASINQLTTKIINSEQIKALKIDVNQINAESGNFSALSAKILEAGDATIKNLISQNVTVDMIQGTKGQFDQFFITHLDVDEIIGNSARFKTLVAKEITADKILAGLGDFSTLFAKTAFINKLNSNIINSFAQNTYDAYIRNAVIGHVSVAELQAGDITLSNDMRIISKNGALLMNGEVLQFAKKNDYGALEVGIQIGYDSTSTPSLIIRDERGAVLFTSQGMIGEDGLPIQKGISPDAIADQLIVGDMIHNKTISTDKLDFEVMQKGDKIIIDQVYTDTGDPFFGTEYTTFKDFTDSVFDVVYGKLFTWIAYATNPEPTAEEFLDNPARARYVGIGTNKKTKDQTTDYKDYVWFPLPQVGTEVTETEKVYHKSVYDDAEHIPDPNDPPQILAVSDGALTVQQGTLVTGSSEWTRNRPEYQTGYYLWTSDKIKLSDGSYFYTPPEKLPDWDETINTIGSTQLIRNSKTLVDTRIYWN